MKPQQSSNFEVGSKWDLAGGRLSLNGAVFHTINKNVLFTVDAVAIPPIYNQDDKQRVDGVTLGASGQITPQVADPGEHRLSRHRVADPDRGQQRPAADAVAEVVGQRVDDLPVCRRDLRSAAACGRPARCSSTPPNTIKAPGYHIVDGLLEYAVNNHLTPAA